MSDGQEIPITSHEIVGASGFGARQEMVIVRVVQTPGAGAWGRSKASWRMTEKLRGGVIGRVRGAIQQSVARVLVGVDETLTIEAKPGGLLGFERDMLHMHSQEKRSLIEQNTLVNGRC